jgi:hypothetical protein
METAIDIGFDVIDLNDDLGYAESILALAPRINAAGIRMLTSASSVSAVAAAAIRHSGIDQPRRVTSFLAPASRHTANSGAAASLLRSVGRPVRVLRDGRLQQLVGWIELRTFPMPHPLGTLQARLFESADSIHLPRVWPSLRNVSMYVDTNTFGVNTLLRLAAHSEFLRRFLEQNAHLGTRVARVLGSHVGGLGYEIEDAAGDVARYAMVGDKNSYIAAVAPAVLAVQAIAENRFSHSGLVLPDRYVEPHELFAYLRSHNVYVQRF